MIENFKEYERVKQQQLTLIQNKKSEVTAKSIMRYIRHKMGTITDEEFYDQEMNDTHAANFIQEKLY